MKKQIIGVAGNLALVLSGSASASLVTLDVIPGPTNPDGIHDTWRVIARFTDPGDQISAVNGVDSLGLNIIRFWTCNGSDIYNQGIFDGEPLNDFPSVGIGGEAWDTYVTIGATSFPSNVQFSPNFLGDWDDAPPPVQVILGSAFQEDDGAWFFFGVPPQVSNLEDVQGGNDTFDVLLLQLGVESGVGFHLEANLQWFNPVSGANNTPFKVGPLSGCIPSPGAMALFGLAGLVGVRHRRG